MWLHMQMHFYMCKSFQLEGLYVTDLLHRCSVNVCSEWTREESKELPVLALFACFMATLHRNSIEHNWGPVYGNMAASERGPGSQEVGQQPWLVEKSQKCKRGGNNFSLLYVKDSANIQICLLRLNCVFTNWFFFHFVYFLASSHIWNFFKKNLYILIRG